METQGARRPRRVPVLSVPSSSGNPWKRALVILLISCILPFSPLLIGESMETSERAGDKRGLESFSPLLIGESMETLRAVEPALAVPVLSVPSSSGNPWKRATSSVDRSRGLPFSPLLIGESMETMLHFNVRQAAEFYFQSPPHRGIHGNQALGALPPKGPNFQSPPHRGIHGNCELGAVLRGCNKPFSPLLIGESMETSAVLQSLRRADRIFQSPPHRGIHGNLQRQGPHAKDVDLSVPSSSGNPWKPCRPFHDRRGRYLSVPSSSGNPWKLSQRSTGTARQFAPLSVPSSSGNPWKHG